MTLLTTKPKPFALEWEAGTIVPITIHYNRLDGSVPDLTGPGCEIWVTFKLIDRLTYNDPGFLQKTLSGGKVTILPPVGGQGLAIAYMTPAESMISPDYQRVYYVDVKVRVSANDEWVAGNGTLTLTQTATKSI